VHDGRNELLCIGVFPVVSHISVRVVLRRFQQERLPEPARMDSFSGHRHGHCSQPRKAEMVTALREAGMPVAEGTVHHMDVGRNSGLGPSP